MTPDEVAQSKEVEFYTQGVAAWYNSALERDKSLLTLSVAGLGVLLTLMPMAINSIEALILYILAVVSFLACVFSVLMIFHRNKEHILDVFSGVLTPNVWLTILDHIAIWSFILGVLFCTIIGISLATTTYFEKDKKLTTENSKTSVQGLAYDSVNGLAKLNPAHESFNQTASLQKSFQGIAQMQSSQPHPQQAAASQPVQSGASRPQPATPSQRNPNP